MPYPWRSRRDSVRRINMSSEPGNESFFCALRPIPRILSLRQRAYASQVQIGEPSRRKTISGCSRLGGHFFAGSKTEKMKGLPYDPAPGGFVYAAAEIGQEHDRRHRLHLDL